MVELNDLSQCEYLIHTYTPSAESSLVGSPPRVTHRLGSPKKKNSENLRDKIDKTSVVIRDDEEILPIIVCPKLQEVVLEGNPITTQRTKISRQVEEILSRRCGVNIQIEKLGAKDAERRFGERLRKKNNRKVPKMDIRSEYKVKSRLPSLKKLDVDEALRKQREKDKQRNSASSISINRDSQSGEEPSDKTSPNTISDLVSTESRSKQYSSVVVQPNNGKDTSVDSCFVTQLDVEADPVVTNEESVVQPVPCPLLPDLDTSIDLSTLPTTIQNCLKELRDLVSCDDLHLAKMFKPLNMNKENEKGVAKSGVSL
ncbi:unnamed protein product [Dibothriocephalus latus]|uniref:Uncharacterized protein n=1 Tax=Dibothriocephalus latus TaxID=60516 RepID=A0A3P7NX21_DIBLA|nr:unnamed protein product [Dibothriocephalus latus]